MPKTKKLLNPRGYLSHTQIDLWQRSRQRYIEKYFYGGFDDITNAYMRRGSETAAALETGGGTGDEILDFITSSLTKYDSMEHQIEIPMMTAAGEVVLLGKLDTFNSKTLAFREYKTGRVPWTQSRANKHGQLKQYQTMIWLKHKKLAPEVWLDWAETEVSESGSADFTGRLESFKVEISLAAVLEYMAVVAKVAKEIDAEYRKHLNLK